MKSEVALDRQQPVFTRHLFRGQTGYVVAPWLPGMIHAPLTIRHSDGVPPWKDADVHVHQQSEEYFVLVQGELALWIGGALLTLRPWEALMVKPGILHAVVGGKGPIEHFVIRAPAHQDRVSAGRTAFHMPPVQHDRSRVLRMSWGARVPLLDAEYQNKWLFGNDLASFPSDQLCLANLRFPTPESTQPGRTRHPRRLHLHRQSCEYYTVLMGTKVLQVEQELVQINCGEILEVRPGTRHVLRQIHTPFAGVTFRCPLVQDKAECSAA